MLFIYTILHLMPKYQNNFLLPPLLPSSEDFAKSLSTATFCRRIDNQNQSCRIPVLRSVRRSPELNRQPESKLSDTAKNGSRCDFLRNHICSRIEASAFQHSKGLTAVQRLKSYLFFSRNGTSEPPLICGVCGSSPLLPR